MLYLYAFLLRVLFVIIMCKSSTLNQWHCVDLDIWRLLLYNLPFGWNVDHKSKNYSSANYRKEDKLSLPSEAINYSCRATTYNLIRIIQSYTLYIPISRDQIYQYFYIDIWWKSFHKVLHYGPVVLPLATSKTQDIKTVLRWCDLYKFKSDS